MPLGVSLFLFKNHQTPSRRLMFFLRGLMKHEIPGLEMEGDCSRGGRKHVHGFGIRYPCSRLGDTGSDA